MLLKLKFIVFKERAIIEVLRDTAESLKRRESYLSICEGSRIFFRHHK